jgi:MFS transporter, DHA1 family, multidrug resistance protein
MQNTFRATAVPLSLAIFASLFGVGMLVPALPILAAQTGSGAVAAGFMVSVFGLARIVSSTPSGWLIDRVGAAKTATLGLSILTLVSLLGYFASGFWPICAAIALQGAASSVFSTASMTALILAAGPQQRGRAMVWFQTALLLSFAISPIVGGWAVAQFGPTVPFLAQAILAALALLAVRFMPSSVPVRATANEGSIWTRLLTLTVFAGALGGFAAFFSRLGIAWNVVPVTALGQFGMTTSELGLVIGVGTAANLLAMPFMSKWIDGFGARPTYIATAAVTIVACIALFAFPTKPVLWLSVALVMFGTGVMIPAAIAISMEGVPPSQLGRVLGAVRTVSDAGMAVGPTAVPALTMAWGQPPLFGLITCLGACVMALLLVVFSMRKTAS